MERDFKGIWIPKAIWLMDISANEKILLSEISSLDKGEGCFATNKYLSDFLGVTENRISVMISKLKGLHLLEQSSFNGRRRFLKTKADLVKTQRQPIKKHKGSIGKNTNTQNINTITNTIISSTPKKSETIFRAEVVDCYYDCIEYFDTHLHPKTKAITSNWLDTIEKMNRIDKIPFEKIVDIVRWARENDFWKTNFLSIVKLRKKNNDGTMYSVVFNEKLKSRPNDKRKSERKVVADRYKQRSEDWQRGQSS